MSFVGELIILALEIYMWIIIASAVVSWLIAFQVINVNNEQARNLVRLLERVTEPVYRPIRRYVPPIGGIDITPIIVIFAIFLLQKIVFRLLIL